MSGTFSDGLDRFEREFGKGKIIGHVVVDQAYAQNQHQSAWFKHPDGGKAFFLRDPLFGRNARHMQMIADKAITSTGSDLSSGVMDAMEDLSTKGVYEEAPWEFADLRASGHPFVTDDGGQVIHNRLPHIGRLSREELRIKGQLSRLLNPGRYGSRRR